jgi:cytochrome c oxidase subunit 4
MTTETATVEETEEGHDDHLSPANYWMIALFLAIVTAVEVAITYIPGYDGALLVTSLIVLGLVKFLTVVAFFMHLKYEPFTMNFVFYFGLLGALALFIAVLLSFRALFDTF